MFLVPIAQFLVGAIISGGVGEMIHQSRNPYQPDPINTSPFGYLPSNGGGGWVTGGR
ncbi:TPA: hypothetical protein QCY71_005781 [Bacillus cereus]|nr:hypothetical protein [Bacillus cereus]